MLLILEQLQHQQDNIMLVKIKDVDDLVRDTNSRAILNVNKNALLKDQMYQEKLKKQQEVEASINNLKEEISSIKGDISKILEMLSSRGK
jgi:3-deoxy-D-manno-octulosonic-acid transferase